MLIKLSYKKISPYEIKAYIDLLFNLNLKDLNGVSYNNEIEKADIRYDYYHYSLTNDTQFNIKFIGFSRIDSGLYFKIEESEIENMNKYGLTVKDIFSHINIHDIIIANKLSFNNFIRKIKINKLLENNTSFKKMVYLLDEITLVTPIEDNHYHM